MPIVTFGRAVRRGTHVIITAYGESGCGKTYSLIKLGRGLVGPEGRIGMLDTETGRGLIYASVAGGYEYAELTPPFTPERYIEAIDAAEEAGIEALIIDSGTHEWEGLGGVLEIADGQTSQNGNPLQGLVKWAKPKARHKKYVQRLLNSRMHLLISLRAKEKMLQLTKPPFPPGTRSGDIISAGYVPIQDKRFVFETTVQLFLPTIGKRGVPVVEKCPEDLLGAFPDGALISEDTGRKIAEWVNGGVPVDHEFDRLKRNAEAIAAGGTDALREHWRKLGKPICDRLAPHVENLGSIARAADQEQDERRREQEESHRSFRPIEPGAADPEDADPFGLPPLPSENSPPAQQQERSAADGLGGPAPTGEPDATTNASRYERPFPGDVGQRRAATADELRGHAAAYAVLGNPVVEQPSLLDPALKNLTVPLPARPTADHLDYFARQMLALIGEAPKTPQRLALIKRANERGIWLLKAGAVAQYDELQAALARPAGAA